MTIRTLTPPATARACINCTAWSPHGDVGVARDGVVVGRAPLGQCRARPPGIDPDAISAGNAAWPVVRADEWCRKFDPDLGPDTIRRAA